MKKTLLILNATLLFSLVAAAGVPEGFTKQTGKQIVFTENKGQVSDQNYQPRPDVLFGGVDGKMAFHIKKNGISYQLNRVDSRKKEKDGRNEEMNVPDKVTVHRVDIKWKNCNSQVTTATDEAVEGYGNYYLAVCPDGVTNVKSYKGITVKNIYNNIDIHYYESDGSLKHDYIVAPNSDYKQIQLEVSGAKIELAEDGSVLLKTSLGDVQEGAPVVFQNGKRIAATWVVKGNTLSFNIPSYNPSQELIIDPLMRVWGTYYGGTGTEYGQDCATDNSSNVYLTGYSSTSTGTAIATAGAHQTTFGGSTYDAFLVKFNTNGVQLWGTYYGGFSLDYGMGVATDPSGNVYASGYTQSTAGISTAGCHQAVLAGNYDAYLVKFNSAGVRQWGTYYGDATLNYGYECCTDASGNVYMVGITGNSAGTAIATAGAHQTTFGGSTYDAYIVKFNTLGVRQWGTYYGGTALDYGQGCCTDPGGNVYLCGYTGSTGNIASATAHQPTFGGSSYDFFLVKFNTNGIQQWGTYYGGTLLDYGYGCAADAGSNVYLSGYTQSTGATLATPGAHQTAHGGSTYDGLLAKFNSAGVIQWATFVGGTGNDYGRVCDVMTTGNVVFAGYTSISSGTTISTPDGFQPNIGGGTDAFLVEFNAAGVRQSGTYYGGVSTDMAYGIAKGPSGAVYMSGYTNTNGGTAIATAGAHQPASGGGNEGFLVKFTPCTLPNNPNNTTPPANTILCSGYSATLTATGSGTLNWYNSPTSTVVLGTGGTFVTPTLALGNYTYYVQALTCGPSASRTEVSLVVNASPTVTASNATICAGSSTVISASGAASYTWNPGALTGASQNLSPLVTTVYTITGNAGACNGVTTITVFVNSIPTTAVTSATLCTGYTTTLVASGASTYTWNPGALVGASQALNPMTTTVYTVTGANGDCTTNATGTITVYNSPTLSVSNATICSGTSTVMTCGGANTYSWNPGAMTGATQTLSPGATTTYTILGSDGTCAGSATMSVLVNITPTISVNNGTICAGQSFTMVPTGASTYTFSSGSNVVTPSFHSNYTVTGTSAEGCQSASGAISYVTVNSVPTVSVSGPGALCMGQSIVLTATGANSYSWSTGATTQTIAITPTASASYSVAGTFTNTGCGSNGTVKNVIVNPKPDVYIETTSTITCKGETRTLTAIGADTYSWSTGSLNTSIIVAPPSSTVYNVVGTHTATGCQSTKFFTLTVSPCTGIEAIATNEVEIKVYPNPNNGHFTIELAEIGDLVIYNAIGDKVFVEKLVDGRNPIDMQAFAQGIYVLQITSESRSQTVKIIKE
jgi:hypothetical protein